MRIKARKVGSALTWLAVAAVMLSVFGAAPVWVQPAEVWVDDGCSGPGSGTQADPYCTIQDGIDNVANGGTVHVAAGTYDETISIDQPLARIRA